MLKAIRGLRGRGWQTVTFGSLLLSVAGLALLLTTSTVAATNASLSAQRSLQLEQQNRHLAVDNRHLLDDVAAAQAQLETTQGELRTLTASAEAESLRAANQAKAGAQVIAAVEREMNAICAAVRCGQPPLTLPATVSAYVSPSGASPSASSTTTTVPGKRHHGPPTTVPGPVGP